MNRLQPVKCQLSPGDKLAAKYCFRAKCKIVHTVTGRTFGEFVTYGKTPDVSHDVFIAGRLYTDGEDLECAEPELVLFRECPVECTREIVLMLHEDPNSI
jgi:hypothetical protein